MQIKSSPPTGFLWMVGKTIEQIQAIKKEAEKTGKSCEDVIKLDNWKTHLK